MLNKVGKAKEKEKVPKVDEKFVEHAHADINADLPDEMNEIGKPSNPMPKKAHKTPDTNLDLDDFLNGDSELKVCYVITYSDHLGIVREFEAEAKSQKEVKQAFQKFEKETKPKTDRKGNPYPAWKIMGARRRG